MTGGVISGLGTVLVGVAEGVGAGAGGVDVGATTVVEVGVDGVVVGGVGACEEGAAEDEFWVGVGFDREGALDVGFENVIGEKGALGATTVVGVVVADVIGKRTVVAGDGATGETSTVVGEAETMTASGDTGEKRDGITALGIEGVNFCEIVSCVVVIGFSCVTVSVFACWLRISFNIIRVFTSTTPVVGKRFFF